MSDNHCGDCARTKGAEIDPVYLKNMVFCKRKAAMRDADAQGCPKFKSNNSKPAKAGTRFERGGAIDGRPNGRTK